MKSVILDAKKMLKKEKMHEYFAKKFDLGLENIEISNEDVPKLNEMFKNLGKQEFFTPIKTEDKPFYLKELKNEVEQTIIKNEPKEVVKLDTLLKEVVANLSTHSADFSAYPRKRPNRAKWSNGDEKTKPT